jgi:hypothetical protein
VPRRDRATASVSPPRSRPTVSTTMSGDVMRRTVGEHPPRLQERFKGAKHAIYGRCGAEELAEHLGSSRFVERRQQQRDEDPGLGSRRFASRADHSCHGHRAVERDCLAVLRPARSPVRASALARATSGSRGSGGRAYARGARAGPCPDGYGSAARFLISPVSHPFRVADGGSPALLAWLFGKRYGFPPGGASAKVPAGWNIAVRRSVTQGATGQTGGCACREAPGEAAGSSPGMRRHAVGCGRGARRSH